MNDYISTRGRVHQTVYNYVCHCERPRTKYNRCQNVIEQRRSQEKLVEQVTTRISEDRHTNTAPVYVYTYSWMYKVKISPHLT